MIPPGHWLQYETMKLKDMFVYKRPFQLKAGDLLVYKGTSVKRNKNHQGFKRKLCCPGKSLTLVTRRQNCSKTIGYLNFHNIKRLAYQEMVYP